MIILTFMSFRTASLLFIVIDVLIACVWGLLAGRAIKGGIYSFTLGFAGGFLLGLFGLVLAVILRSTEVLKEKKTAALGTAPGFPTGTWGMQPDAAPAPAPEVPTQEIVTCCNCTAGVLASEKFCWNCGEGVSVGLPWTAPGDAS